MVKVVVVEEDCAAYVKACRDRQQAVIGVLLGNKDSIIKFVRTAPNAEAAPSKTEIDIDESWVGAQALELGDLLPGGIEFVGVFAISTAGSSEKIQPLLRKSLYCAHKFICDNNKKLGLIAAPDETLLRTALHFDIDSGKLLYSKQFDVLDRVSSARPIDIKFQSPCNRWSILTTHLDVNIEVCLDRTEDSVEKQLKAVIDPYCESILNGLVTIDGEIMEESTVVDPEKSVKAGKGKKQKNAKHSKWGKTLDCKFYVQNTDQAENDEDQSKCVKGEIATLNGGMFVCAYLPPKATAREAIALLKNDAIRSLNHRCSLLSDHLQSQGQGLSQTCALPKRMSLNKDDVKIFDYIFPWEGVDHCITTATEVFDITVTQSDIDSGLEVFPPLPKQTQKVSGDEALVNTKEESVVEDKDGGGGISIRAIIAAGAAALAVALSYFTMAD